jgi:general transcription factor 3C polypeptide 3 (transcription factor C subunit 4)
VVRGYRRVCELWGRMMKGAGVGGVGEGEEAREEDQEAVREWMVEAEKMVETFRETRNLFLTSRVGILFYFFGLGGC